MNPLEALKELQVKPINDTRKPVAIVIKGQQPNVKQQIDVKPAKRVAFQEPQIEKGEKDENVDLDINEMPIKEQTAVVGTTIAIREDKTFDRDALLKKLTENKLTKVSVKPIVKMNEVVEEQMKPLPVIEPPKKAKKIGEKRVLQPEDIEKLNIEETAPLVTVEPAVADEGEPIKLKPPKEGRKIKQVEKGIAVIGPETKVVIGDTPILERLPRRMPPVNIKVPNYYLNNREIFINFINSLFQPYKDELDSNSENISCDSIGSTSENFELLTHQKIVRDYMNLYTPYRGLLLYHGLGSGKSCTSIAIAEGMKSGKKVIIMLPASLQTNYREELKKCGDSMYKKNQFWEWISLDKYPEATDLLSSLLNLEKMYIERRKGAWFVNVTKPPNFADLSPLEQKSVNDQLDEMINTKYKFINYNGLRRKTLETMTSNFTKNIFDDSVVVIDEAHNLISRIVNKLKKKKDIEEDKKTGEKLSVPLDLSLILYEYLLSAKNAKIVLLSGTPVINYPNEFGILFNILRGYIKTWEFPLNVKTNKKIDKNSLREMLLGEKSLDYLDYTSSSKTLTVTRNPFGFKNTIKRDQGYIGVSNEIKDETTGKMVINSEFTSDADFEKKIIRILSRNEIDILPEGIRVRNQKALPDKLDLFKGNYIDSTTSQLKNVDALKRRIIGLSSYFRSAQESLLPRYANTIGVDYHIVRIEMSNFQFQIYEMARIEERKSEKSTPDLYNEKEQGSSYRIFSRLFCNFVMPNRPMPEPNIDEKTKIAQAISEAKEAEKVENTSFQELIKEVRSFEKKLDLEDDAEGEIEADEILEKIGGLAYKQRVNNANTHIKEHSNDFLTPEALETYSPKYLRMLDNIQDPRHIGLHLVYSQFRNLEGIGLFSLVLEKNGFARFKIKKSVSGWELNMLPEDAGKPCFALYTGTETKEEKEIIRNIYNGDWDYVDINIRTELLKIAHNNNMGEIIKVFMITSSGSEGISLKNTRYVHVMEPYWHPVRLEQVIGRARRICSHKGLPEALRTLEVFVYLMVFSPEQLKTDKAIELKKKDKSKRPPYVPFTSDQYLYEISEMKSTLTKQLTDAIKESAFDCYIYNGKNCVNFGDPNKNDFSYVPNYSQQDNDPTVRIKKKVIEWEGKFITIVGKRYIYRRMSDNLLNIYDEQSYMEALTNPNVVVRQIGTLEIDKNGNEVFKELVT